MGKIEETRGGFFKKIFLVFCFYAALIFLGAIILGEFGKPDAFFTSVKIITGADIEGLVGNSRLIFFVLAVCGEVVQFYLIYIILEFVLEGRFHYRLKEVRQMKHINNLSDHYIIAGGGRVGENVAKELARFGKSFVILEKDKDRVDALRTMNFLVKQANTLDERELLECNITKASHLISCLDDDGANLLLVLTAKELNPNIKIGSRASQIGIVNKLKHAGASYVVLPEILGGVQLAHSLLREELSNKK